MLPRKIFENLYIVVAISVPVLQFSGEFCLKFLPLILSVSPSLMHFIRTFSIMYAQGVRLIAIEKVQNYGKIIFTKNVIKNSWWWAAPPSLDPALTSLFNAACLPSTLVRLLHRYSSLIFVNFSLC